MDSEVPSSHVIFDLKPSPHSYLHPKTKTGKTLFLSIKDLLEGIGLFSITFSFKDREKRGEQRKERENRKSVRVHPLANGREG